MYTLPDSTTASKTILPQAQTESMHKWDRRVHLYLSIVWLTMSGRVFLNVQYVHIGISPNDIEAEHRVAPVQGCETPFTFHQHELLDKL